MYKVVFLVTTILAALSSNTCAQAGQNAVVTVHAAAMQFPNGTLRVDGSRTVRGIHPWHPPAKNPGSVWKWVEAGIVGPMRPMFGVPPTVSFSDRDEAGMPDYLKGARTMHPTRYAKEAWATVYRLNEHQWKGQDGCTQLPGRTFIFLLTHCSSPYHFMEDQLLFIHNLLASTGAVDDRSIRIIAGAFATTADGSPIPLEQCQLGGMLQLFTDVPAVDLWSIQHCVVLEDAVLGQGTSRAQYTAFRDSTLVGLGVTAAAATGATGNVGRSNAGGQSGIRNIAERVFSMGRLPASSSSSSSRLPSVLIIQRLPVNPISNRSTSGRVFLNIHALERELQSRIGLDWSSVSVDDFETKPSYKEQILLIRSADVVVMAHGAGCQWGIFMEPTSALLELGMCEALHKFYAFTRPAGLHVGVDLSKTTSKLTLNAEQEARHCGASCDCHRSATINPVEFMALVQDMVKRWHEHQR